MSLTVNALRKLQQSGAFPAQNDGAKRKSPADSADAPQADATDNPTDATSEAEVTAATPDSKSAGDPPHAPPKLEREPPVSTDPELDQLGVAAVSTGEEDEDDVKLTDVKSAERENVHATTIVPMRNQDGRTQPLHNPTQPDDAEEIEEDYNRPATERLKSKTAGSGGPNATDDLTRTTDLESEAGQERRQPTGTRPQSPSPVRDQPLTTHGPYPKTEPVQGTFKTERLGLPENSDASPAAPATPDPDQTGSKHEHSKTEWLIQSTKTERLKVESADQPVSEPFQEDLNVAATDQARTQSLPENAPPFGMRHDTQLVEDESIRPPRASGTEALETRVLPEHDATPPAFQSGEGAEKDNTAVGSDDLNAKRAQDRDENSPRQMPPTIATDIDSLQAMIHEVSDESQHGDHDSAAEDLHELTANPPPVTAETYRLFYDPVIPTLDLPAGESLAPFDRLPEATRVVTELNIDAHAPGAQPTAVTSRIHDSTAPTETAGVEAPQRTQDRDSEQAHSPHDHSTPEPRENTVVIPTAYERDLLDQMADKNYERHFVNLQNQIRTRSNNLMKGSYLIVSPNLNPRTADVTANLAMLLERDEHDVLMIDANLEKQTLTRRFEALNQPGLCDALSDTASPSEIELPTSLKRLRFIPSGDDVSGVSRLPDRVDPNSIRRFLTNWRSDTRTVLCDAGSIDSALVLPMAHAFDAVLLVVSLVDLNVERVRTGAQMLSEFNIVGCVVTDA